LSEAKPAADPGRVLLSWTSHPVRRRPAQGAVVALLILATAGAIGVVTRSAFWGAFSGLVLFLSLESFFLPTRYDLGEDGLAVKRTFSRSVVEWGRFRRVYRDRHGLTLSPYRRKHFMEAYRAVRVLYDGGDPAAIEEAVRARLPQDADWAETSGRGKDA